MSKKSKKTKDFRNEVFAIVKIEIDFSEAMRQFFGDTDDEPSEAEPKTEEEKAVNST
jgi:hypothetical protein